MKIILKLTPEDLDVPTKRRKPLHISPMLVKIIFVLKLTEVGLEDILSACR